MNKAADLTERVLETLPAGSVLGLRRLPSSRNLSTSPSSNASSGANRSSGRTIPATA